MRHEKVAGWEDYETSGIPGLRDIEQSVIAEILNERGCPADVLFDAGSGVFHADFRIVGLEVPRVLEVDIPNPNTVVTKKGKADPSDVTRFTFKIRHDPDACMYPHCVIETLKNGQAVTKIASPGVKTARRDEFGRLAQLNAARFETVELPPEEQPVAEQQAATETEHQPQVFAATLLSLPAESATQAGQPRSQLKTWAVSLIDRCIRWFRRN